jgi:hypothetical protein
MTQPFDEYAGGSTSRILARLLKERRALAVEYEQKEAAFHHAIADLLATFTKIEAERDCYRDELWHCMDETIDDSIAYRARAALEQGDRIREGKE